MKTTSKIEQEVNQIRLAIYEKIKDMTPAQVKTENRPLSYPVLKPHKTGDNYPLLIPRKT